MAIDDQELAEMMDLEEQVNVLLEWAIARGLQCDLPKRHFTVSRTLNV